MAIDTAMKRFSMLNMAGGVAYPRLFQQDGAVDADDRAFLLRVYGGNAFDNISGQIFQAVADVRTLAAESSVRTLAASADIRVFEADND
jgi:hypothetical protein